MHTDASSGACAQNHVDFFFTPPPVDAAKLLLRADAVLVRLLISIRLDYLGGFGVVSNKLSMKKHQNPKGWKMETRRL